MDILNESRPKTLLEFIGNRKAIKTLQQQLKEDSDVRFVCLVGPNGSGKTTVVDLLCEGYERYDVKEPKELSTRLIPFVTNKTISSFFEKKRKIVVLEDVEVHEKSVMTAIQKTYEMLKTHKIFMIISCKILEEKRLHELNKKTYQITYINNPTIQESFLYLIKILEPHYDIDSEMLLDLVKSCKGNIRDVMLNIENTFTGSRFKDMTNFEITKSLCRETHTTEDVVNIDDTMVSYILYENVVDELCTNKLKCDYMAQYAKIRQYHISASILEKYLFMTNAWEMYGYLAVLRLMGTYIVMNSLPNRANMKSIKYRYSQLLSKTSHKQIMNQKIKDITSYNRKMTFEETLYVVDNICRKVNPKDAFSRGIEKEETNLINTYKKYFFP